MRVLALLLLLSLPAAAQNLPDLPDFGDLPEPTRYLAGYVSAGLGWNRPFGGHWGDKDAGFSTSQTLNLAVSKRIDSLLSYGGELTYGSGYRNRAVDGLSLRIISLTPFVKASFPEGNRIFYGLLGGGLYQWSQPAYASGGTAYPSDSGSSAGLNLGGGVYTPFLFSTMLGLELRWHHIFNISGAALDLGAADSVCLAVNLQYGVWRDRKTPVPTP